MCSARGTTFKWRGVLFRCRVGWLIQSAVNVALLQRRATWRRVTSTLWCTWGCGPETWRGRCSSPQRKESSTTTCSPSLLWVTTRIRTFHYLSFLGSIHIFSLSRVYECVLVTRWCVLFFLTRDVNFWCVWKLIWNRAFTECMTASKRKCIFPLSVVSHSDSRLYRFTRYQGLIIQVC